MIDNNFIQNTRDKLFAEYKQVLNQGIISNVVVKVNGNVVSHLELRQLLQAELNGVIEYNNSNLHLLDSKYFITDRQSASNLCSDFKNKEEQYIRNQNDCDKFALKSKTFWNMATQKQNLGGGIANGIVTFYWDTDKRGKFPKNGGHAVNYVPVFEGKNIIHYIYEPQTGEFTLLRTYFNNFVNVRLGLILL